jgi:hypothetical protein
VQGDMTTNYLGLIYTAYQENYLDITYNEKIKKQKKQKNCAI